MCFGYIELEPIALGYLTPKEVSFSAEVDGEAAWFYWTFLDFWKSNTVMAQSVNAESHG